MKSSTVTWFRFMRINKYLSKCGVASRRGADRMIQQGRLMINGVKVTDLGVIIDEAQDQVFVDGKLITPPIEATHLILNKPKGIIQYDCEILFARPDTNAIIGYVMPESTK